MKGPKNSNHEDHVALFVTVGIHLALLIFFLLYTFSLNQNVRPSFMEVKLGAFKTGTQAQHAVKKHKKVATTPSPSKKEPKKPQPNHSKSTKEHQATQKKTSKPVQAPKQKEDVKAKKLKTPKTKEVKPQKKATKKKKKKVASKQKETKNKTNEPVIPPKAQQAKKHKEGAKKSGSQKGTKGKNADQGHGNQKEKSGPYNLNIEGIHRKPEVQPLPENASNYDATITLKFQVTPDGKVVNIIPTHKSGNPRVDRQVIKTLRKWRFSSLPSKAPQKNQTGTITFHFVLH